jgi:predicted DNA-binding transcriptional regulator YafY
MTRTNRVLDLLDALRAHERTSIGALAAELAVSPRTLLRDLAVLRDRGWPIAGEPGPGGGIRLERGRGLSAVHLGVPEAVALWLAARLSETQSPMPWTGAARSALDKVLASLPEDRRRGLRRFVRRVIVGRPATEQVRSSLGRPSEQLIPILEQAFAADRCMSFAYVDRHGRRSRRQVEPHGLMVEAPAWYLLARDLASSEARIFRMDRIRSPELLEARFKPDIDALHREIFESWRRVREAPRAGSGRSSEPSG